jgi:hypothetical protein
MSAFRGRCLKAEVAFPNPDLWSGYHPSDFHHQLSVEKRAAIVTALVAYGGVGTLLLCHLRGNPIARQHNQPSNNGGNYFAFDAATRRVHHEWKATDA